MKLMRWSGRPQHSFSPACEQETFVFGARRPGFPFPHVATRAVQSWISFMQGQGITRVVCLLPPRQLDAYDGLLDAYRQAFGQANILWAPIDDFQLAEASQLIEHILPFLAETEQRREKAVVHCAGGIGRTGHVLAAWLVSHRGMSNEEAIAAVKKQGRNARESGDKGLDQLLNQCRAAFSPSESSNASNGSTA